MFEWNFAYYNVCPLPLVLILGATEKSQILVWFFSAISYLTYIKEIPLFLPFRLNSS